MKTRPTLISSMLVLAVLLCACGGSGSGGSSNLVPKSETCSGSGCETDAAQPPSPTQTPEPGECSSDAECPQLKAPCTICADGTTSCPQSICESGYCSVTMRTCQDLTTCGGSAGATCAPGYLCTDDPNDDCDPSNGGADCSGMCVPDGRPAACGGVTGASCPPDQECTDDPSDDCDPGKGGADCPGICQPIDQTKCEADQDCPQLRIACSVCPDDTPACPSSTCVEGRCVVAFPSCPSPVVCGRELGECKPGYHCDADPNGCDPATGVCQYTCVPDALPESCGGLTGEPCPRGFVCVDDPGDQCDPMTGGADCPGVCQAEDISQCASDADCPHILAPCTVCADGSYACPEAHCLNGQCSVSIQSCADPGFCGGIAGFPCPAGFTCVDQPGDGCDPDQGGADCGGICVPEDQARPCGGILGATCPPGYECADTPGDDCDPAVGGADCPGSCQQKMSPCSSDADCPVIGAPCQLCADGTAACPASYCRNGECRAEFPSCKDDPTQ